MIHKNDLNEEYLNYFEEKKAGWEEKGLVDSVYYNYGYSYSVFNTTADGKEHINVGKILGDNGMTVNWQELVGDQKFIEANYDVIGGRYPTEPTDLVLIVDKTNSILPLYFVGMGLIEQDQIGKASTVDFKRILGDNKRFDPVSFYIPNSKAKYKRAVNEKTGNEYFVEKSGDEIVKMYNGGDSNVFKAQIVGIIRQEQWEYNPLTGKEYDKSDLLSDFEGMTDINNIMNILNGGNTAMTRQVVSQMIGASSLPSSISIYASEFDNKDAIAKDLDAWNKAHPSNVVKYTDSAALMMSMISQIIKIITIALVCFSSVSLVVSSIMIGIITYVSVVERTKEIGILRSLGARKRDVSNIFNAETFIIGLSAGTIGVIVTYLLSIPINIIIKSLASISGICMLNPLHALLMIVLSIVLTSIAGIVPSRAAAKKDPVIALRTE